MILKRLTVPLLHHIAPFALDLLATLSPEQNLTADPMTWKSRGRTVYFRNRFGIAGGVDKDGAEIDSWRHFGAGFVEVGTVTPKRQAANAGRIIGRDDELKALWNRMGFPSRGGPYVFEMLREYRWSESQTDRDRFPVFVNLGKNRETSLEHASDDYCELIDLFCRQSEFETHEAQPPFWVDGFVVNISSPNTTGLRDLFSRERLTEFLTPISERLNQQHIPGLLKLSPDLDPASLENAVRVACDLGLDGFVATNTTIARDLNSPFPKEGGVSGAPLTLRSRECLTQLIALLGPNRAGKLIISAGGVLDATEAKLRLQLGADLVQVYAALAFQGPWFFARTIRSRS